MKKTLLITTLIIFGVIFYAEHGFSTSDMSITQTNETAEKTIEKPAKKTIGNTADTLGGFGKFSLELEGERIFKREMVLEKASFLNVEIDLDESFDMESQRAFLNATLGLHPKVDVFIKLGAADANLNYTGGLEGDIEFDGDLGFTWGAGIKIKLFEGTGGFRIMTRAKYLSYEIDSKFILDGEDFSQAVDPGDSRDCSSKIKAKEWSVDLLVSKSFKWFSPYLGIGYSDSEIINELDFNYYDQNGSLVLSGEFTCEFEQDNHIGVFLGTGVDIFPQVLNLNIKGRFIDETAVSAGLTYKF